MEELQLVLLMVHFSAGAPSEWPQISISPDPPFEEESDLCIECRQYGRGDIELHFLSNNSKMFRKSTIIYKECDPQADTTESPIFKYVKSDCPLKSCTRDQTNIKTCRYNISDVSETLNNGKFWCEVKSSRSNSSEFQVVGTISTKF